MDSLLLDYVVIALYFAVMIGAGYWGLRRARNADDYLVAGGIVVVALMATRGLFSNDPIIYGMLVSLVVFVVVSLLTPRTSAERMRAWERRLEGPGAPP